MLACYSAGTGAGETRSHLLLSDSTKAEGCVHGKPHGRSLNKTSWSDFTPAGPRDPTGAIVH
jgi:hypothetical protein